MYEDINTDCSFEVLELTIKEREIINSLTNKHIQFKNSKCIDEKKKLKLEISQLEKKSMLIKNEIENTLIIDELIKDYTKDALIKFGEIFIDIKLSNQNNYVIMFTPHERELYKKLCKLNDKQFEFLQKWVNKNKQM